MYIELKQAKLTCKDIRSTISELPEKSIPVFMVKVSAEADSVNFEKITPPARRLVRMIISACQLRDYELLKKVSMERGR